MKFAQVAFVALVSMSSFAQGRTKPACAFGDSVAEIGSARFSSKKIGATFKLSREKDAVNPLLWVYVTEIKDKKTGRLYQINRTNDDAYDGGNVVGWIEDVTNAADGVEDGNGEKPHQLKGPGEVVADISDSEITCRRAIR